MNDNLIRHPFFALLYGFSPAPRSLSLVDQLISLPAELIINLSHTFTILFFFLTCFCFFLYNCPSRLALPCVPRLHCSHAPPHTYTHHTPHTHTHTYTHTHTRTRETIVAARPAHSPPASAAEETSSERCTSFTQTPTPTCRAHQSASIPASTRCSHSLCP